VREVIPPEKFYELGALRGYDEEKTRWYWDAHWVLPAFDQIVEAYCRGLITPEERDKYFVWHDYQPTPRPGITKSDLEIMAGLIKRPIPRVDLRYAWEMGRISDEELVERYRWLRYEDDAPLMAEIQKIRALHEELMGVVREEMKELEEGYIKPEKLEANLLALGLSPIRVKYYVARAVKKRHRKVLRERIRLIERETLEGIISIEEAEKRMQQIIVDPETRAARIDLLRIKLYKK